MAYKSYYKKKGKKQLVSRWYLIRENKKDLSQIMTLYDTRIMERLIKLRDKNRLISYILSVYRNKDIYDAFVENGYIDPAMNHALSKCGYSKSELNKQIIDNNWELILTNALKKFMTWAMPTFDREYDLKFATYFNAVFPDCYQKEFLNFRRPEKLVKMEFEKQTFFPVEEVHKSELMSDGEIYHPRRLLAIEFLSRFNK